MINLFHLQPRKFRKIWSELDKPEMVIRFLFTAGQDRHTYILNNERERERERELQSQKFDNRILFKARALDLS